MLKNILDKYYTFPRWQEECPRFKKLTYLDHWLEGTFYDKIPYAFTCEEEGGRYIPLHERRPAVQHNLPQLIASLCARKLFGGRHAPRLRHKKDNVRLNIQAFVDELKLIQKMIEVVKRGSVGSVLILFQFRKTPDDRFQSLIEVVKPQVVTPIYDQFQDLTEVRIHYTVSGSQMLSFGFKNDEEDQPIKPTVKYWFIRHVNLAEDCIYFPVREHYWNPVDGYVRSDMVEKLKPNLVVPNTLKFVPAVWIQNLTGGVAPDGKSTFESALNNFIEYDYMYSQIGRGLFYHASQQLVIKGEIAGTGDDPDDMSSRAHGRVIGPTHAIQLPPDQKDATGGMISGSDAKLLDTGAQGLSTGIEFASKLKHFSLEQNSVARKDLESINGSMSGKAMELMDQDFFDLIEELRIQYGENGYLILLKKAAKAAKAIGHPLLVDISEQDIDGLTLQYAAHYTPDPQEFLYLVQALTLATGQGQKNPEGGVNAAGAAPAAPSVKPLLTPEEATQYLKTLMDFSLDSQSKPTVEETEPTKPQDDQPFPDPEEPDEAGGSGPVDIFSQHPAESNSMIPIVNVPY